MDCAKFVVNHGKGSCIYSNHGAGYENYYKNPTMLIELNGSNNSKLNSTGNGEGFSLENYSQFDLPNWS